jgi:LmbE family N-acetylglucosaminyl deacetylase
MPAREHVPLKQRLRPFARAVVVGLLRLRARPLALDPAPLLVVAPHQDDATLGCGGLLFQKRRAGQPVHVLYLTDGSASHPGHPTLSPADIARIRRDEAHLAKSRLGVDSACLHFLDLPDGRLDSLAPDERADAIARIACLIVPVAPATVLLPSRLDGSSEHEAGFPLVLDALARAGLAPRILEYPVWSFWSPALLLRVLAHAGRVHRFDFPGYGPLKLHALSAYASQFRPTPPWPRPVLPENFSRAFSREREFFFECPR